MRRTAIVIPCFNEEQRLDVDALLQFSRQYAAIRFLLVDDCSSDGTPELVAGLLRTAPEQFESLRLAKRSGKAEAVRKGFLCAFGDDYEYIGFWDADLATPLSAIPALCDILDESDSLKLVVGSRVRLLGRKIERRHHRHYLGRIFATFASLLLGLTIYDTQCGAKLFRNTEELGTVFRNPFRVNWTFDVEILARIIMLRSLSGGTPISLEAAEYPLEKWTDVPGSKLRPATFFIAALELLAIYRFLRAPGARSRAARFFQVPCSPR